MRYKSFILECLVALLILGTLSSCAPKDTRLRESTPISYNMDDYNEIRKNPEFSLLVPTYITKIKDNYFIVDCYHNRVIYNKNLQNPLNEWSVMTDDIIMGHTIASDGTVYLIDDTENNRILVMEEAVNSNGEDIFVPTQEFNSIGTRPHYILYNEPNKTFYAWSSMTGEMFLFKKEKNSSKVYLSNVLKIDELDGFYARSFSIIDDKIYVVSGNGNIIVAKLDGLSIVERYPVPDELFGMIQISKIEDYYYITISTDILASQEAATMIRTKDLANLSTGDYEDVYGHFIGGGTPYCVTKIDDIYYLCEHRLPGHSIWSFNVENNEIVNATTVY